MLHAADASGGSRQDHIPGQHPEAGLETIIAYIHVVFNELAAFYQIFDKAVEEKNTWVIQMYGDSFNSGLRNDAHVKAARKLAGLPVWD